MTHNIHDSMNQQYKPRSYVQDLQVSGHDCFEGNEWRGAISYFLTGIAKGDLKVTCKPKINFGSVALYRGEEDYNALTLDGPVNSIPPKIKKFEILETTNNVVEVDRALVRLMHDDTTKMLVIHIGNARRLYIWKDEKDELHVRSFGLDDMGDYIRKGTEQGIRKQINGDESGG